jgi:AraC family transcriptional regulator of adaptative response/methylated-DNA-[protein]-cysteine methyltransferase
MLTAASDDGVCQLEFADRRGLERSYAEMRRRFQLPVVPGENSVLKKLAQELREYFAGSRREFTVPVTLRGTEFQERVWRELQRIPYGQTASYETIASKIGSPTAVRAVARANGTNRLYLLIPCHRVIAKDGTLSGYGGGVWRKRMLLEWEQTGRWPEQQPNQENLRSRSPMPDLTPGLSPEKSRHPRRRSRFDLPKISGP